MGPPSRGKGAPGEPREHPRDLERVLEYHEATKHRPRRYASGPEELDWDTQPDPFRVYRGAPRIALERVPPGAEPRYEACFRRGHVPASRVDARSVSQLFFDALALSAWKQAGDSRWALRVNPSSGNLHPTEGYLVCGAVAGLSPRPLVAHYAPREHALEVRAELPAALWEVLVVGLPPGSLLVGLTSLHWRESWKYGERAFRYSELDLGHAIAGFALSASALGWEARVLETLGHDELARLLGTWEQRGPEAECAGALLAILPFAGSHGRFDPPPERTAAFEALEWRGEPSASSRDHVAWRLVELAEEAARKPRTSATVLRGGASAAHTPAGDEPLSMRRLIHRRRSALGFDRRSGLARDAFFQTLARTLPDPESPVHGAWPATRADLLVFVHRVQDLDPGLYLALRDPTRETAWRGACGRRFEWARPEGCPAELALFLLDKGDARSLARSLSCNQDIAADGCFALAMLAEFEPVLESSGPWAYRLLHEECGFIGQLLYLEAEALGLRATGMGCFFDDLVHSVLGLEGRRFQSLYHFAIGGPVEDRRLTTLPAYPDAEGETGPEWPLARDVASARLELPPQGHPQ